MNGERWQEVYERFSELIELEDSARGEKLAGLREADPELVAEIETLLKHHEEATAEAFLDLPAWVPEAVPLSLPDFGDYSEIEYLGHGGMGVVYRARQKSLSRQVALKMSLPHVLRVAEHQFFTEAESMAGLQHPNIIRVHEVARHEDRPYFTMDLIEGQSLGDWEKPEGELRPRVAIVRDVARAVHHAHQRGILHRDLKPDNILLDQSGHVFVTDFGLAKRVAGEGEPREKEQDTGGVVGTASFMSPEQADPEVEETILSDVYGLGAVLYHAICGRPPHRGESRRETLKLARSERPPAPCSQNPAIDRDLQAICQRALARSPEDRYGSAEGFADDLDRWLAGRQSQARSWSLAERIRAWRRRRPGLALVSGIAAVLLAIAVVLVTVQVLEALREPARMQLDLARHQAETVRLRLMQLAGAVDAAANTPALGAALAAGELEQVQREMLAAGDRLNDLDGASPFESWWLVDRVGALVARWPHRLEAHEGWDFSERDYVRGALACVKSRGPRCLCQPDSGAACAYVSKPLFGLSSQQYKLAIGRAVVHEGEAVGVIVIGILASQGIGVSLAEDQASATTVIARADPARVGKGPERPATWVLLFHPAYQTGTQPLPHPVAWRGAPGPGIDERYRDPAAALDPRFGGFWLAAFVPVEGTEFIVGAQRRFSTRTALGAWFAVGAASFLLLLMLLRFRKRRIRGP